MTAVQRLPVFEKFIQDLRLTWAELPDAAARMEKGQKLLEALVKDSSLREVSKKWPSTEGRKNLLFYEDPDYGFAINGVVRVPGRKGSIHDHGTGRYGDVQYGRLFGCRPCRPDTMLRSKNTRLYLQIATRSECSCA